MKKLVPTINEEHINDVRAANEKRATWMYLLYQEGLKQGLGEDFARNAIFKCGCMEKALRSANYASFDSFLKSVFGELTNKCWEEDVTWGENEVVVENHYCPLLAGWQKLTDDDALLDKLCDVAMEGDRGLFNNDFMEFHLEKTLGAGDDVCRMRFVKK